MKPAAVVERIALDHLALSGGPDALRWNDAGFPLEALSRHGCRLHSLKGDRKGCWAARVYSDCRIVVPVEGGRVFDVDLVDYHRGGS